LERAKLALKAKAAEVVAEAHRYFVSASRAVRAD